MSVLSVAQKDFRDALRARSLLGIVALFVVLCGAVTYLYADAPSIINAGGNGPESQLVWLLFAPLLVLVPIASVMIGYKAIVGERSTGTMKLLLKQPHSRLDILIGKFIGRSGVVTVAVLVGLVASLVVVVATGGSFSLANYVVLALFTIALVLVFVAIAVAVSSATGSINLAAAGGIGAFLIFQFLWTFVPTLVRYVVNGFSLPSTDSQPDWFTFLGSLSPGTTYQTLLGQYLPDIGASAPVPAGTPFYLEPWFGFVILAGWIVVSLGLGYLRFRRVDL